MDLKARHAKEMRFKIYGLSAITLGLMCVLALFSSVLAAGLPAFKQTFIQLQMDLPAAKLDKTGTRDPEKMKKVSTIGYSKVIRDQLQQNLKDAGIDFSKLDKKQLKNMISKEAPAQLRDAVLEDPSLLDRPFDFEVLANGRIDGYYKGRVTFETAALDVMISPDQLVLADAMKAAGLLKTRFNGQFFYWPDASDLRPEAAGLGVALLGSLYMVIIVFVLAVPLSVCTAVFLEEFAPKNWFTDLIEINISNLAAVPSIVFGILGLSLFINFMDLPQSAPIVGGLCLTLMTLPTVIIAARAAIKAVPPSIKSAALGLGASRVQAVFHHVLPSAAPGILTGTILGLAQALGETAPLLLIGMVAFVREYPSLSPDGIFDPSTALPVQIYNWTVRGDPAFVERASGAIIVLLCFMITMNALAIILRRRVEKRW
ncbi:MAG: phosphate ABC transporter permease PstA [Paracoccaceae bacterium]